VEKKSFSKDAANIKPRNTNERSEKKMAVEHVQDAELAPIKAHNPPKQVEENTQFSDKIRGRCSQGNSGGRTWAKTRASGAKKPHDAKKNAVMWGKRHGKK